jgi:hypothetical protein
MQTSAKGPYSRQKRLIGSAGDPYLRHAPLVAVGLHAWRQVNGEQDRPAPPRRHVRRPRPDLPWRLRPRPPLHLRDGGTFRDALLAVLLTIGLLGGGLSGLIEPWSTVRILGSAAMFIAGLVATTLVVFYVKRPPYT